MEFYEYLSGKVRVSSNPNGRPKTEEVWKKNESKKAQWGLFREGYFISYNEDPGADEVDEKVAGIIEHLKKKLKSLGVQAPEERRVPETALVVESGSGIFGKSYYILTGDFRKDYQECNSLEECLEVYKKNIQHKSPFSNEL